MISNFYLNENPQQEAHETVGKRKAECRENRLSSGEGHNLLLDVELSYKGDPAPKQPSSMYDSSQKLNVIIKGICHDTEN